MNRDRLFRRWERQYLRLLRRQDLLLRQSRRQGLPEQIHDLRVTLRRLRLMVRVSAPLLNRSAVRDYRAWSRRVTNATSPVRDFDVSLEWLAHHRAPPALLEALQARRQRLWRMGRRSFRAPPPTVNHAIRKLQSTKRGRQRLARRYPARFARLHARVVAQIPHFFELDAADRHAFRRTLRLLRYLRELALTPRQRGRDPVLRALARPQAALGEYQNLLLAQQIIAAHKSPGPTPALRRALLREQVRWQREIRASLRALARIYRAEIRAGHMRSA